LSMQEQEQPSTARVGYKNGEYSLQKIFEMPASHFIMTIHQTAAARVKTRVRRQPRKPGFEGARRAKNKLVACNA